MRTLTLILLTLAITPAARAHFLPHHKHLGREARVRYFERSVRHDETAVAWLRSRQAPRTLQRVSLLHWHLAALRWHRKLLADARAKAFVGAVGYWAAKQIAAATIVGRESGGDPWPNCPDPFDGGGSWQDTVNCENSGSWLDSAGFYRCGLQFDPMWERRFGRLCP